MILHRNRPQQRQKEQLYQITAEDCETGKVIRVGPAMAKRALEPLLAKIQQGIRLGKEKRLANPSLVPLLN